MLVWGNNKNLNKSSKNNRNKSPQLGLKYLNDIIKKIQISNYKTYHVTPHQSKKNSNDKKKYKKNIFLFPLNLNQTQKVNQLQ